VIEQPFFGHWTLTVSGRNDRTRFRLVGTDAVDGIYLPAAQPFVLEANGAEWRMIGERLPRDSPQWEPLEPITSSAWDPQLGLVRQLRWFYSFSLASPAGGLPTLVSISRTIVDCRSHDPDLAAVPTPPPPDFSVPERNHG
jgi:hypothetical protein